MRKVVTRVAAAANIQEMEDEECHCIYRWEAGSEVKMMKVESGRIWVSLYLSPERGGVGE